MGWKLSVPSAAIDIELTPSMVEQERVTGRSTAVTYWEGSVAVKGTSKGKSVSGQGYVEMTGYAEKFKQKL
jgi:predicted secreted hydrolase